MRRRAPKDVSMEQPFLHDCRPQLLNERSQFQYDPGIVIARGSQLVQRGAAALCGLEVWAAVQVGQMYIHAGSGQGRGQFDQLALGTAACKRRDDVENGRRHPAVDWRTKNAPLIARSEGKCLMRTASLGGVWEEVVGSQARISNPLRRIAATCAE